MSDSFEKTAPNKDMKVLNKLIDSEANVYEMTCVAIKEANIYSATYKKKEIEAAGGKVVTYVLERALDGDIKYTGGEKSN